MYKKNNPPETTAMMAGVSCGLLLTRRCPCFRTCDSELLVGVDDPFEPERHTRGVGVVEVLHFREGVADHIFFSQTLVVHADDVLAFGEVRHRSGATVQALDGLAT